MSADVEVKSAFLDVLWQPGAKKARDLKYKLTLTTDEGMNVDFTLSDKAVEAFLISVAGVAMQVRAKLGVNDDGHDHGHHGHDHF